MKCAEQNANIIQPFDRAICSIWIVRRKWKSNNNSTKHHFIASTVSRHTQRRCLYVVCHMNMQHANKSNQPTKHLVETFVNGIWECGVFYVFRSTLYANTIVPFCLGRKIEHSIVDFMLPAFCISVYGARVRRNSKRILCRPWDRGRTTERKMNQTTSSYLSMLTREMEHTYKYRRRVYLQVLKLCSGDA